MPGDLHLLARVGRRAWPRPSPRTPGWRCPRGTAGPGRSARRRPARPHGACAFRWAVSSSVASSASAPGGTRRLISARARRLHRRGRADDGRAVDAEHGDGGAGPDAVGDRARADQLDPVQHLRVRAEVLFRVLQASQPASAASPSTVVEPSSARSESSIRISAASASGAAPPNWPECRLPSSVSTWTAQQRHAAQRRGDRRQPDPEVARVADDDGVGGAAARGAASAYRSRPPVPCSSEPSTITLTLTGTPPLRLERAQREQVHDERRPCSRRRRARTSGRRARSARTAG